MFTNKRRRIKKNSLINQKLLKTTKKKFWNQVKPLLELFLNLNTASKHCASGIQNKRIENNAVKV